MLFLAVSMARAGGPQQACFFLPPQDAPQPHQGLWHDWPQGLIPTSGLCLYAQQLPDSQVGLPWGTPAVKDPSRGLGVDNICPFPSSHSTSEIINLQVQGIIEPLELYGPSSVIGMWAFSWGGDP